MKNYKAFSNEFPKAIQHIAESVSNLIKPVLPSLLEVFVAVKSGVNKARSDLKREMDSVQIEGDAAVTRLMMPSADKLQRTQGNYFNLARTSKE